MRLVIQRVKPVRTFPLDSRDATDPAASKVDIKELGKAEKAAIQDLTMQMSVSQASAEGGGNVRFATKTVRHKLTVASICGWHNVDVQDENGTVLPYVFRNNAKDTETFLDALPQNVYENLVAFVNGEEASEDDQTAFAQPEVETVKV